MVATPQSLPQARRKDAGTQAGAADGLLQQGMRHLQAGEWRTAQACFVELVRQAPHNGLYRELLERAQLQAQLGERPPKPRRRIAHSRRVWALILLNLLLWMLLTGRHWYHQQVVPALAQQRELATLEMEIRRGQQALAQGDLETAEAVFREVLQKDPQNSVAQEVLATIQTQRWLAEQYAQAMQLIEEERWAEALDRLRQIEARAPGYREVTQKIAYVQRMQRAAEAFMRAEELFQAGAWAQAAWQFEQLRRMAPTFESERVTARLFTAYLRQAQALLHTPSSVGLEGEIAVMESALEWLSRARELRPSDAEVKRQRHLAYSYLRGLQAYRRKSWELAILYLNNVYPEAPRYRDGRAAAWLQAAFVQAGIHYQHLGRTERAAERFRQAIAIGVQGGGRAVPAEGHRLLARADGLARQGRVDEALALYSRVLSAMGFEGLEFPPAPAETSHFEPWREEIACAGPGGAQACPELRAKHPPRRTAPLPTPPRIYVVRPGDSLSKIAKRFGTTIPALMHANPIIKNPRLIRPGWQLVIPTTDH